MPDPSAHAFRDLQRLLGVAIRVHVEQAGHNFVQRVERRPDVLPFLQTIEKFFGERAQVPVAIRLLALREFSNDRFTLRFQSFVAQARVAQGAGRKKMPREMAAKLACRCFPSAQWFSSARQSRGESKAMKKPVVWHRLQILLVDLGGLEKWSIEQSHLIEWKRAGEVGNLILPGMLSAVLILS